MRTIFDEIAEQIGQIKPVEVAKQAARLNDDVTKEAVDIVQFQTKEENVAGDFGSLPRYSERTKDLARKRGRPKKTDNYDLDDTGLFQRSIFADVEEDGIKTGTTVPYIRDIEETIDRKAPGLGDRKKIVSISRRYFEDLAEKLEINMKKVGLLSSVRIRN